MPFLSVAERKKKRAEGAYLYQQLHRKLKFYPLHTHDTGSIYDGFDTAEQRAQYLKTMGFEGAVITNHGTISTVVQFWRECAKLGLNGIPGMEGYFQPDFLDESHPQEERRRRYHITLIAQNNDGYESLCRLLTEASREKSYYKPINDFESFEKFHDGLIVLSGCVAGYIPQLLIHDQWDEACRAAERFLSIFGTNFYFEVQPQAFEDQIKANEGVLRLSEKFGRPAVMTNDSHFSHPRDFETYLVMRKMGNLTDDIERAAAKIEDAQVRKSKIEEAQEKARERLEGIAHQYKHLYIAPAERMAEWWEETMGTDGTPYLEQAYEIGASCSVDLVFQELVPSFQHEGITSKQLLKDAVIDGLKFRRKYTKVYVERAVAELKIIFEKGYTDYFLLCQDIIQHARSKGIGVGIGRGSVCGSLVAYALQITGVDPIELGIIFERFLSPARATMPDIDMDFCSKRRGEVVEYILQKFAGKSAQIANYILWKTDNLVNDLAKALDMDKEDRETMKLVLAFLAYDLKRQPLSELQQDRRLQAIDQKYPNILLHFTLLYGQIRAIGKHAAGIAITSDEIEKYVGLIKRGSDSATSAAEYPTVYDMSTLSKMNVVKMDILGLATETLLQTCEQLTGKVRQDIDLRDELVYRGFAKADTTAIFQLESRGAKEVLRRIQPENIHELMAALAINRPGATQQGSLEVYVNGKFQGIDTSSPYAHFTRDTYGALIYQEQTMQICREVADLDWGLTSKVIKNIDAPVYAGDPLQAAFVEGAVRYSHMDPVKAADLYYRMTRYSFNKGHSAGYALMSYYAMWFKTHFPLQFYCAALQTEGDEMERKHIEADAVRHQIFVLLPHVNGSWKYDIVDFEGDAGLQIGTGDVKGVGPNSAMKITAEAQRAKFASIQDMKTRIRKIGDQEVIACLLETKEKPAKDAPPIMLALPKSVLRSNLLAALESVGAMDFSKDSYRQRCLAYCRSLTLRGGRA